MLGHSLSKVAALSLVWQGFTKDLETCTHNCETEEVGLLQDIMMRARNKMKLMKPEDFKSTDSCWSGSNDTSWSEGALQCENANFYTPPAECIADGGMKLCLEECKVLCENTPACKGIAYLADTEICYMHGKVGKKEDCEHTEAWKYSCEPPCPWKKEVGKTFGTDSLIPCAPTGDNAVAACATDGGYSNANREFCQQLCQTTTGCIAFSFMAGGSQGDVCYLSTDGSKTEPCEGTEVWYTDCPPTTVPTTTTTTTTFTKHDCWEWVKDKTFSKNDALSCADLNQGLGLAQCDVDG
jgi:hypothetical protein